MTAPPSLPFAAELVLMPTWASMSLITGLFAAFGIALLLLVNRLVHHSVRKSHNEVGGFIFATEGVIYGVLLAFVVILVWEDSSKAADVADAEGTVALALYRNLSAYPDANTASAALVSLREYALSVVHEEYPRMNRMQWDTKDQVSRQVETKSRELWRAIAGIVPATSREQTIYGEILRDRSELTRLRAQRLQMAKADLPGPVWVALILGALMTIGFSCLFGTENFKAHLAMTALLSAIVGMTISLIVLLDYPFSGEVTIKPETLEYLLEVWN